MERKPRKGKEFPKPPSMIHFSKMNINRVEMQSRIINELRGR